MPRYSRRGGDAPLFSLSDGVERALRAAAPQANEREEDHADVGGHVHAAELPADGVEAVAQEAQDAVAHIDADDAGLDDDADGNASVARTESQGSPREAGDVLDEKMDEEAMDEAVVDGAMAHEEDAQELRAAEAAVEEEGEEEAEAVQLDAVVVQPTSRAGPSAVPRPPLAPSRYAFQHGKGGKHIPKRYHRRVLRDSIQGITKPAIRRLARRGGIKRMSGMIYEEARGVLKVFLENVLKDAVVYCEHAKRKTCTASDIVYALRRQGRVLYGFGK